MVMNLWVRERESNLFTNLATVSFSTSLLHVVEHSTVHVQSYGIILKTFMEEFFNGNAFIVIYNLTKKYGDSIEITSLTLNF